MEYGCIGEKLAHSFSKEIHNALADYQYELKHPKVTTIDQSQHESEKEKKLKEQQQQRKEVL